MIEAKKVKKDVSLCSPKYIVHKPPRRLANNVSDRRRSISLSVPIFEFIKSRCSLSESKKNNRKPMPVPHQSVKQEHLLKSTHKLSLKEWILNSPSSNVLATSSSKQFSGRIHPSFEDTVETTTSSLRPRDGFCFEGSNSKSDNDDGKVKKDASIVSQTGIKKRVRFRLPQVVDIFILDSADGYYFSN